MATWPIVSSRYAQDAPLTTDLVSDIIAQEVVLTAGQNSPLTSAGSPNVANGSFEIDANNTVQPTGWTFTAGVGGSGLVTNTDWTDGAQSYLIVQDTTAGHTGGVLNSLDSNTGTGYLPINSLESYQVGFSMKCSRVDVTNKVVVNWFNNTKGALSSTTVYNGSPLDTHWHTYSTTDFAITPPNGAAFATISLMGGQNTISPPGANTNIFFDGVFITPFVNGRNGKSFTSAGTITVFTVPSGVFDVKVTSNSYVSGGQGNLVGSVAIGHIKVSPGQTLLVAVSTSDHSVLNFSTGVRNNQTNDQIYSSDVTGTLSAVGGYLNLNLSTQALFSKEVVVLEW